MLGEAFLLLLYFVFEAQSLVNWAGEAEAIRVGKGIKKTNNGFIFSKPQLWHLVVTRKLFTLKLAPSSTLCDCVVRTMCQDLVPIFCATV